MPRKTKVVEVKKRRGRKGKQDNKNYIREYNLNGDPPSSNNSSNTNESNTPNTNAKTHKKVVENVILHLKIFPSNMQNANHIIPYNVSDNNYDYLKESNLYKTSNEIIFRDPIQHNKGYIQKSLHKIQIEFHNKKNMKLPLSTTIACYQCSHQFSNEPIGVPVRYDRNQKKYYIEGVFCSFNCCARYIFDHYKDPTEPYSLLQMLHKDINNADTISNIPLAPPRETLKLFGGNLSIEEYRDCSLLNKRYYNVVMPPIVSLVPMVEENVYNYELSKTELRLYNSTPFLGKKTFKGIS